MLSDAQIHAEAGKIIQIAMGKINQVSGDRRRSSRVWAANEDPLAYTMGVEAIVSLVHRALSAQQGKAADAPASRVQELEKALREVPNIVAQWAGTYRLQAEEYTASALSKHVYPEVKAHCDDALTAKEA